MRLLMFIIFLSSTLVSFSRAANSCYSCDQMNVMNGTCNLGEMIQQCSTVYSWCVKKWNNTIGNFQHSKVLKIQIQIYCQVWAGVVLMRVLLMNMKDATLSQSIYQLNEHWTIQANLIQSIFCAYFFPKS